MKTYRIDQLLNSLGYIEARRLAQRMLRNHQVLHNGTPVTNLKEKVTHAGVTVDGKPLDPLPGMVILMHKPSGFVCSHTDSGQRVYDLLPPRFLARTPQLNSIGRLDKDATGLLLLTDDGQLIQRLTNPKRHVPKVYEVTLADPLKGNETEIFAAGTLMLNNEEKPLLPAEFTPTSANTGTLTLHEGRYHQVKRMFGAIGNKVTALHRSQMGTLVLDGLAPGKWTILTEEHIKQITT